MNGKIVRQPEDRHHSFRVAERIQEKEDRFLPVGQMS